MSVEQVWPVAAGAVVVGLALVALLVAVRAHACATRSEALARSLAERLAVLDSPVAAAPRPTDEAATSSYVITGLGDEPVTGRVEAPLAQPIDGRLFVDIVARESVVKAASWTYGLRRALAPETRNRIRFEVRQETRRAGRERRAEMKQALREFRARERAGGRRRTGDAVGEDVA